MHRASCCRPEANLVGLLRDHALALVFDFGACRRGKTPPADRADIYGGIPRLAAPVVSPAYDRHQRLPHPTRDLSRGGVCAAALLGSEAFWWSFGSFAGCGLGAAAYADRHRHSSLRHTRRGHTKLWPRYRRTGLSSLLHLAVRTEGLFRAALHPTRRIAGARILPAGDR